MAMVVALLALAAQPALAGPTEDLIANWYTALRKADAAGLGELLSVGATVDLADLGVVQSRQEFLDSMEEWGVAVAGSTIRYRIETLDPRITVLACYDFPSNEMLMRETFTLEGGLVTHQVQVKVASSCGINR